jgi:hypothetical protein
MSEEEDEDLEYISTSEHLDEKTKHLDLIIERVVVLGKFLRDNMNIETEDEEINSSLEEPIKQYNKDLDELADYVLEDKRTSNKKKELIRAAIDYSTTKYALRRRYRGELFFQHSLRVAKKINVIGGDLETVIVGLLHDIIEENPRFRELKEKYKDRDKEIQILTQKASQEQEFSKETIAKISTTNKELEKTIEEYYSFKGGSLTSIKNWTKNTSKELKIKTDAGSVTEMANKLTKNFYDYYYYYQQKMFVSEKYGKKNISKKELLRALRVFVAKGCDRQDNIETMERFEENNQYSFTTQQRLYAIYKNITTINRMRNFLTDYDPQLRKHELTRQRGVSYSLFNQLLNATLKETRKDRQHLEEKHVKKQTREEYSTKAEGWIPTTIKTKQTRKTGEQLSDFDLVIQKYDKWLHYSKEGLSNNKEDFNQQYVDCLAFEKILERFKKDQEYTLRGYKVMKDEYENGNS